MLETAPCIYLCISGVILCLIRYAIFSLKRPVPYPPGPRPLPFLGNIRDISSVKPWIKYAEWGAQFGDMTHVQIFGKHIILLNSVKVAMDMLDKKSSKYSDRPILPMAGDLVGCKYILPLTSMGNRFRETRKLLRGVMGTRRSVETYHDVEIAEARNFLKRVLADPTQLSEHIRTSTSAVMLRITYGYQIQEGQDHFVDLVDQGADLFTKASIPGAYLVDFIPILKYIPEWVPGATFKKQAREWKAIFNDLVDQPYQFVKCQMTDGIASKSYTSALLEGRIQNLTDDEEHLIKWSANSLYGGGADTTVSVLYSLFLAMTLYPDVQKRAQAEIDAIVGPDRLPAFSDRASLPYIEAVVTETLRWHTVAPLGFPHVVSEDDIHNGYYIPKGSVVIPNIWFMLHDPNTYPSPMEFRPERFLQSGDKDPEMDPRTACFGFGRRACPGVHLADASLWINTATSLAVFKFSKAVEDGIEITPELNPSTQTISRPEPFKCSIQIRSDKALELIQADV